MIQWTSEIIHSLEPHQVFVFGSNATGFHGAGAAGLACRGEARNTWRSDPWFLEAIRSAPGSAARVGKWAVFGQARGFQQGKEGCSYAIVTVTKPGAQWSVSTEDILGQLITLWDFIRQQPEREFLITPLGEGYAGYGERDMQDEVWGPLEKLCGMPTNVRFIGRGRGNATT